MSLLLPWLTVTPRARLRTERIVLEAPRRAHYRQWAAVREASRAHLTPFEPAWATDELSFSAYRRRLHRYAYDRRSGQGLAYFVVRAGDGALVGGVTLANIRRGVTQAASVGYWTGLPHVRQGYASEALAVMLRFAYGDLGLHRVEAACLPRNRASIAVLERAGFRQEGLARSYLKINGYWEDHLLWARLADDVVAGRADKSARTEPLDRHLPAAAMSGPEAMPAYRGIDERGRAAAAMSLGRPATSAGESTAP